MGPTIYAISRSSPRTQGDPHCCRRISQRRRSVKKGSPGRQPWVKAKRVPEGGDTIRWPYRVSAAPPALVIIHQPLPALPRWATLLTRPPGAARASSTILDRWKLFVTSNWPFPARLDLSPSKSSEFGCQKKRFHSSSRISLVAVKPIDS